MLNSRKYFMFISYLGSAFRGSQSQLCRLTKIPLFTVQDVLEDGIKNIFKIEDEKLIRAVFCSRTDKGVHAVKAPVTVFLPPIQNQFILPDILKIKLNDYFKNSAIIRILEVYTVSNSFLFSKLKKEKTYLYRIGLLKENTKNMKYMLPIIEAERTFFLNKYKAFNLEEARKAAQLFEGKKDFGAIVGRPSKNNFPTVCNILTFKVEKAQPFVAFDEIGEKYNFYHFVCRGDRFLRYMVRRMVSLTLAVGFGMLTLDDIQKLFDEPNPSSWPKSGVVVVPGSGLYLVTVNLNFEEFIQKENQCIDNSVMSSTEKC